MIHYRIYQGDEQIESVWALSPADALDQFAQMVSGYETFGEMMRSGTFSRKYQDITVS